jgi:DNA replication protein DnaC
MGEIKMEPLKDNQSLQKFTEKGSNAMTDDERLQKEIDIYNESEGELADVGIDCHICKNRGYIAFNREGYKTLKDCSCMFQRKNKNILRKSGLAEIINNCTFESYTAKSAWQQAIKEKAIDFANNPFDKWFFIGGQVGCGKTHICTAICGELMKRGIEVIYITWQNEIVKLKRDQYGDGEAYDNRMWKLSNVPILYIDDFFKSGGNPTKADTDIAQDVIDYRYKNNKTTIISTEYNVNEIYETMNSIGSRIIEMAKGFIVSVDKNPEKDHRLNADNA